MTKSLNAAFHENPAQDPIIFCDFDGTVTQQDVTDRILEELADPSWREVESAWVGGLIGSRECLEHQMALVSASAKELNQLIDAVPLDPGFEKFYRFTESHGLPFYILSDGFDYVIRRILRRAGANGELRNGRHLFTSSMRVRGHRLSVSFPHGTSTCTHGCATCKAAIITQIGHGHRPIIFIGDGLSDRFAIEVSDVVFAKKQLLTYCRSKGMACRSFETFGDIESALAPTLCGPPGKSANTRGIKARSSRWVPVA